LLPHLNGLQHLKVLKTTFEKSTFWNPAALEKSEKQTKNNREQLDTQQGLLGANQSPVLNFRALYFKK
jgi:hypothetical protein